MGYIDKEETKGKFIGDLRCDKNFLVQHMFPYIIYALFDDRLKNHANVYIYSKYLGYFVLSSGI